MIDRELARDICYAAEEVCKDSNWDRNPLSRIGHFARQRDEHYLRTLCGRLSPQIIVIQGGVPVCIGADEQDVRDFIYATLRGVEHQARIWTRDDDGQPEDITEKFCDRWFADTGAAYEPDWDSWLSQFPAFVQAHYETQAREQWQAAHESMAA